MARESTLNVSLTPELQSFVKSKVETGRYETASEVVRDGLRALQDREQMLAGYWDEVREKVREARGAIDRNEVVDGPAFMKSTIQRLKRGSKGRTSAAKKKKRS